jgi:hypothetical protein
MATFRRSQPGHDRSLRTTRSALAGSPSVWWISDPFAHPGHHTGQGLWQCGRLGAAGHGHVGLAAAFAADLLGNKIDQLTGLDLAQGCRAVTPAASCTLSPSTAASTMAAVLSLSLSLSMVSRRVLASAPSSTRGQDFHALALPRPAQQLIALVGGQLAFELGHFFFQVLICSSVLTMRVCQLGRGAFSVPAAASTVVSMPCR